MKTSLFALLLLVSTIANAADFEAGIGYASYSKPINGNWYQNGFANSFNLHPTTYNLGMTGYASDSIRWHVGYINLGGVTNSANFVSDANYNFNAGHGCNGKCEPLSSGNGSSHLQGIYATLAPEVIFGDWKLFAEGGLWYFKLDYNFHVSGWQGSAVNSNLTFNGINHLRYVFGGGVQYKNTQLKITDYNSHMDNNTSFPPNFADNILVVSINQIF